MTRLSRRWRGGGLRGAAAGMAVGTTLSRLTGLFRVLALAYALPLGGGGHLSDAYNLANNAPNQLYDVVLGGVLSATFIPVFVERLATRAEDEAWRAISAVVTVSVVGLVLATVLFWFLAPDVVGVLYVLDHAHSAAGARQLASERAVTTTLLRWFVPQIALYGLIALATALLNTRRRFLAPMWVPIANNLVCIVVLLSFAATVTHPTLFGVETHTGQMVLLGLGTTLGVAVQALLLILSLRAARLGGFHWTWAPRHEAVRSIITLSSWTFGFVLANQAALFLVQILAVQAGGDAPVSSYMYAYTFMQVPYAVVAVSIMSAVTPDLAERWSTRQLEAFRHRLTTGLRSVLSIIVPASIGMLVLAKPTVTLLLAHGASTSAGTAQTGATLGMFALGLPGFCTFLYVVRVLQAMQRTRTAFWLYLVENAINVVLALALVGPLGVRGLALSLSVAYSIAALVGLEVLRRWLGHLGDHRAWAPLRRATIASVVMGVVVLVVSNLSGAMGDLALLLRVGLGIVIGALAFVGTVLALGAWDHHRRGLGSPGPGDGSGGSPGGGSSRPRRSGPPDGERLPGDTAERRAATDTAEHWAATDMAVRRTATALPRTPAGAEGAGAVERR